jgi:hypothetical protein
MANTDRSTAPIEAGKTIGEHGQHLGEPEDVFYTLDHIRLPGSDDQDQVPDTCTSLLPDGR